MSTHITPIAAERFWARVDKSGDCWLWTGIRVKSTGYGLLSLPGDKLISAHRIAYEVQVGPIPDGLFVLHHCDNRLCVRGDHLFVGTQAENMADMVRKGRAATGHRQGTWTHPGSRAKGERHGCAILTIDQVRSIRNRIAHGERQTDIAADFGVSKSTVNAIKAGRIWRDSA